MNVKNKDFYDPVPFNLEFTDSMFKNINNYNNWETINPNSIFTETFMGDHNLLRPDISLFTFSRLLCDPYVV